MCKANSLAHTLLNVKGVHFVFINKKSQNDLANKTENSYTVITQDQTCNILIRSSYNFCKLYDLVVHLKGPKTKSCLQLWTLISGVFAI